MVTEGDIDAVFMMGSLNAIVTRFGVTVVEESTLGAIVSTITFAEVRSSWVKVASEPEIGSTVIDQCCHSYLSFVRLYLHKLYCQLCWYQRFCQIVALV